MALFTTIYLAAAVTQQWTMSHGAKAFAATIGPQCLTAPENSSISADGDVVTVTDTAACAAEIQEIAKNWQIYAAGVADAIVTVTGSPEGLAAKRAQLEARYGQSPNPRLTFLAPTQACRCLVIAGKLSVDASKMVESDTKPQDSGRRAQLEPLDNPLFAPKAREDLIWRDDAAPSAGERPLVN